MKPLCILSIAQPHLSLLNPIRWSHEISLTSGSYPLQTPPSRALPGIFACDCSILHRFRKFFRIDIFSNTKLEQSSSVQHYVYMSLYGYIRMVSGSQTITPWHQLTQEWHSWVVVTVVEVRWNPWNFNSVGTTLWNKIISAHIFKNIFGCL
jgi:hypothetical protein